MSLLQGIAFFASLCSGCLLACYALHAVRAPHHGASGFEATCFYIGLGVPLGLGISSFFFFLQFALPFPSVVLLALEIATPFVLLLLVKPRNVQALPQAETCSTYPPPLWLVALFAVMVIGALLWVAMFYIEEPNGGWDAWMIWNQHASFFVRPGAQWNAYLTNELIWSHPDYPLFVSLNVARCWTIFRTESLLVPLALAVVYMFATVAVLMGALARLRSSSTAYLAAIALLGTPIFIIQGASQCADVALGLMFLASTACCALADYDSTGNSSVNRYLLLSGAFAGLAAWTKNEGMLFVMAFFAARVVKAWQRTGATSRATSLKTELLPVLLGLIPFIGITLLFKTQYAPPSDLVIGQGATTFQKLLDPTRYATVASYYLQSFLNFGMWVLPPLPLMALYLYLMGVKKDFVLNVASPVMATVALMAAGYFMVYVTTPYPLRAHLDTSLSRLMLQLWPMFLLGFFLTARTAEELQATNQTFSSATSRRHKVRAPT